MLIIQFDTKIIEINTWSVLVIPKDVSEKLPSRGMVMVGGTLNNVPFKTWLEPDGNGSHWFHVSDSLCEAANIKIGDVVFLKLELLKDWIEPDIPEDILSALITTHLLDQWNDLTTKARWEWIRWIRSTKNPQTRQKRIEVACSKLESGKRRPCCFDQSQCTEPFVSKGGVLLDVADTAN
jgi:hypothetical protein